MVLCPACQNEIEPMDCGEGEMICPECGEELGPEVLTPSKQGYVCGSITEAEAIPKKKMTKLTVDVGADAGGELTIVTNAKHCAKGRIVVVATVGAVVGDMDDGGFEVKKTSVGGVMSAGMLCDCPMLGWTGGSKGQAVFLDAESFAPGAPPPSSRPRKED